MQSGALAPNTEAIGKSLNNGRGATGSDMVATVDYHSSGGGGRRTYEGRTPLVE